MPGRENSASVTTAPDSNSERIIPTTVTIGISA